eukprot:GEMP01011733.1.p1 GENE.GEMP01011733.1~~GEMP01011733.1.p1  ORF type:complete len:923 (+),score=151.66 GEMP01011733.1:427-3195(+)
MSQRLKYSILKLSSEDPEFPGSELLAHSSQTKGWQSARFCDFPQEIGLGFEQMVHLRQVQFLSHQSKIATKIELFTAVSNADGSGGGGATYETARFKRLGYLSLDSNERSNFQARELKSVYVDVSTQFVKVLLHKCHINKYNLVNQVAVIALNCLGEVVGPDLAIGPPGGAIGVPGATQRSPSAPSMALPREIESQFVDEMKFDPYTLDRIKSVTTAKNRAIELEDYDEAKRCKDTLHMLRKMGQALKELEQKKQQAVSNEEYDVAKSLKLEIDRIHASISEGAAEPRPGEDNRSLLSYGTDNVFRGGPNDGMRGPPQYQDGRGVGGGFTPPINQQDFRDGYGNSPPDYRHNPPSDYRQPLDFPGGDGGYRGGFSPPMNNAYGGGPSDFPRGGGHYPDYRGDFPGDPGFAPPESFSRGNAPPQGGYEEQSLHGVRGSGEPLGAGNGDAFSPQNEYDSLMTPVGAVDALPALAGKRTDALPVTERPIQPSQSPRPDEFPPESEEKKQSPRGNRKEYSADKHPLKGIPNAEALADPEPLNVSFIKEAQPLIDCFGEYIVRCLYSKSWNLRDAAYAKLDLDIDSAGEPIQLEKFRCLVVLLKRAATDRIAQVFLTSVQLLHSTIQGIQGLRKTEVQPLFDSFIPLLVERGGDSNARCSHAANESLLVIAKTPQSGAIFTSQYMLRPVKKKNVPARVYANRLKVLGSIANEVGIQPVNPHGIPLEPLMNLAMEWFSNPSIEVRQASVEVVGCAGRQVGVEKIERFLEHLRPAQREVFEQELERMNNSPTYNMDNGMGKKKGELSSPSSQRHRAMGSADQGGEDDEAPFTCQFCAKEDPTFTPEGLDIHYWKDCPMLLQCDYCQQVIEIASLREHYLTECEGNAETAKPPSISVGSCPLCETNIGEENDESWREHLLRQCTNNPRKK